MTLRTLCFAVCCVVGCLTCSGQWATPPKPTTTQKVSTSMPATGPATLEQALALPERQAGALDVAMQRPQQLDDTAMYILLSRLDRVQPLRKPEFEALDKVESTKRMVNHPQEYRLRPVRMRLHVSLVHELQPGKGLSFTRYWPKDRKVWQLDCLNAEPEIQPDQPVILFSTRRPAGLPRPDHVREDGTWVYYDVGPVLETPAVFYKVFETQDKNDNLRKYPVLITWEARKGHKAGQEMLMGPFLTMALGIVVLMVGGFFILKRIIRIRTQNRPGRKYRALREEEAAEMEEELEEEAEETEEEDIEVDPDLKAAAQAFREEHELDDDETDRTR